MKTPAVSVSITSASALQQVRDERGEPVVVAVADLVVGDGVVLVDDRQHAEVEQALQRLAGVQVLRLRCTKSYGVSSTWPPTMSCVEKIAFRRSMRRGWPTAASACSVPDVGRAGRSSPSAGMPAAIAPDSTSTTR